jgi:hypothetical protein
VDMSVSHGTINNRIDIKDGSNTPMWKGRSWRTCPSFSWIWVLMGR